MLDLNRKLYTCRVKCAICMKLLGEGHHLVKELRPNIPRKACLEHPDTEKYGFVLEWEPEDEQPI